MVEVIEKLLRKPEPLMALMMLHRFSDPIRHICIEDWQDKADDFVELQELIWPDE